MGSFLIGIPHSENEQAIRKEISWEEVAYERNNFGALFKAMGGLVWDGGDGEFS